ncbi:Tubulin--tyrosine ligase [Hondaea fermentalgiana]|uniref:Tubulin--tyrosine ligase n=1 Tax=Hondaea fermentalgiana TaxID=2315210 RepID=A0A2R5GL54_9STRA|nr:Tubulin--tyrosine ligase [Hondaea fermentalgiana]|eukprot:GBG29353.1 Tubulin--tyrosine ligase [Hondaea fermentalgiana]
MSATSERRVKSKMKKSDPANYTIHDFLNECKTSDAADSRFEDAGDAEASGPTYFVTGVAPAKLGNLYTRVGALVGEQEGWKQKKDTSGRFHFILGGARGAGIPFKRFAQLFKWDYGITPHCNYFRGHVWLTQKVKLIQTLRQAGIEHLTPEAFLFFPSSADDNETEQFRIASESGSKRAAAAGNTWLVKASDATRGERTLISSDYDEIMTHIETQDKTGSPLCVQRYLADPLLLPGGRKFDLRFFVLVDKDLDSFVSSQVLVKTCQHAFSMDDLADKMAHLSTAAVQKRTDSAPSDMPVEQLAKWLSSEHGANFEADIAEPAREIIAQVLAAAQDKLENVGHADFTSFQVFAFDFAVDAGLKPWFVEVSAPIDFPDDLVDDLARDVVDLAVQPVFAAGSDARAEKPCEGRIFMPLPTLSRTASSASNNSVSKK